MLNPDPDDLLDHNQAMRKYGGTSLLEPNIFFIDLTGQCNLKCKYCYRPHLVPDYHLDMDEVTYSRLLPVLASAKAITLGLQGEPTLSRHFLHFVTYCAENMIPLRVVTNGTMFDDNLRDKLKDLPVHLTFSLDAIDEAEYQKTRQGGSLENIITSLEYFKEQTWPKTELSVCIDKTNYQNLLAIIEFCEKYNIALINFNYREYFEAEGYPDAIIHVWDDWLVEKAKIEAAAKKAGVFLYFPGQAFTKADSLCHRHGVGIDAKGHVYSCTCKIGSPVGNINQENFANIWTSDFYAEFRQALMSKTAPGICKHCYHSFSKNEEDPLLYFKNYKYINESLKKVISLINQKEYSEAQLLLTALEKIIPENKTVQYYLKKIVGK